MSQLSFHNSTSTIKTPNTISPLFQKAKTLYILWCEYYKILPKAHRYTLGQKIDNLLIEIVEKIAIASFLKPEEKIPYVQVVIKKIDLLKIFLMILWETKSIDDKQCISLSEKTNEVGRMSDGWLGKLVSKQNSPAKPEGEKQRELSAPRQDCWN